MDRRHFLKTAAVSAGALTLGTTASAEIKDKKVNTPLEAKEYIKESARKQNVKLDW